MMYILKTSLSAVAFLISAFCILFVHCAKEGFSDFDLYPCRITSRLRGYTDSLDMSSPRVVVVGDIHGCYEGLLEVLYEAGVTRRGECVWREDATNVILMQMGDIVDRGNGTLHVFRCLTYLQNNPPKGSIVMRVLGNHDVFWLQGQYHDSNKKTDTTEVRTEVVDGLKHALLDLKVRGAHVLRIHGMPLIFVHAGFRPAMVRFVQDEYYTRIGGNITTAEQLAKYVNLLVHEVAEKCKKFCAFNGAVFDAGPDRGGTSIGGPIWTDFSVLKAAAEELQAPPTMFLQIVGHTIAFNRIRSTRFFQTIGVDGGMYLGGRVFLEIKENGRFYAYEKNKDKGSWNMRDLTGELCDTPILR